MHPRVLEVLNALSTGRVLRACDLAVRFNTSERTVRRDIADLREQGYRIDAAPGVGGGYVAPIGAVLPPLQFSPHEAFTIAMALRTLAGQGIPDSDSEAAPQPAHHVESAMCKLGSVLPSGIVAELTRASHAITSARGNEPAVPLDILVSIASAVAGHRLIDLNYLGGTQDGERRVEPYRIVVFGAHWYVFAWDVRRLDWRTFRLDRIQHVHTTTFEFRPRPTPDPVEFVRERVVHSVYQTTVKVRVYASAEQVSARVPARAATVTPVSIGECELVIGGDVPEWLVAFLLQLGHPFTILEPDSFRADVRRFRDRLTHGLE
ncbi:MAG TPA: YafY family transcriptional regulator [Candidatus Yaniella excrementavium]|nr:YafY family transcriptional regulator [Candidatus Yaniella excrementavium]